MRVKRPAGAEIISQLERSTDVYLLLEGRVRVIMVASTGRQITYQILPAGQLFGELAAIDGGPRSAGVSAEDDVVLGRLDQKAFRALLAAHPTFAFAIMRRLASLSRWLSEKVFEYHAYDVKGRVYTELLRMADETGGPLHIADRDMASRVGTTRENVTRIYADLKQRDIIRRHPTSLELLDGDALRTLLTECEFG